MNHLTSFDKNLFLTVIVPVYNEKEGLKKNIFLICKKISNYIDNFEILIVNDGSSDGSGEIAEELSKNEEYHIRVIHHPANIGPGSGVHTGIKEARGEFIVFIPADIAIDLDQFDRYLDASKKADIVVGLRSNRKDYSLARKINSYVYIWMIKILFGMKQKQFNYVHMYKKEIFNRINIESKTVFLTAEILIKARDLGHIIEEVNINYIPRETGIASCGKVSVILKTFLDLTSFWIRWRFPFSKCIVSPPVKEKKLS